MRRRALNMVGAGTGLLALFVVGMTPSTTPEERRAARARDVDWETVTDDPLRRLELSILIGSTAEEGGWIELLMEERFNVDIKPIPLDPAAHSYRKPLMLAGGQVPDVFVDPDPIEVQRDAYHGFLLPIPHEVILRHAPNYVKALNSVEPIGWLYANWNGINYGVPTMYASLRYSVPGLWRADWLEAVGLVDERGEARVPETLEDMHEALERFTTRDPDGNGIDDTYGMSGDVTNWWWASFGDVFGAHGVTPFDWMERDGVAVWGGLLPETRAALRLLHDWYAEGLIHPDFVTDKSRETLHRKFLNGRTGYIYYDGKYHELDPRNPNSLASRIAKLQPGARLACGRFPRGPGGRRGGRVWSGGHVIVFGSHLADEPEKVLRVLRMLDAIVTDEEFYLASKLGRRGEHWDYRDAAAGPASGIEKLAPYTDHNMARRALVGNLESGGVLSPCGPAGLVDRYTPRDELAFNQEYRNPRWAMKDALGKPDVVPSAAEYLADLRNFQMTVFAEMIRGDRAIDTFDGFVRQWLSRGGERMTEEANRLLKDKKRIYRIVGAE